MVVQRGPLAESHRFWIDPNGEIMEGFDLWVVCYYLPSLAHSNHISNNPIFICIQSIIDTHPTLTRHLWQRKVTE